MLTCTVTRVLFWLPQVRNLRACIKAAIDFVSPESAGVCLELGQERRVLTLAENAAADAPDHAGPAPERRRHADKLQVVTSFLSGFID